MSERTEEMLPQSLSSEQQRAIHAWKSGRNVKITAVPGAGKTFVILKACVVVNAKILILAYNRALCEATRKKLFQMGLSDRVLCYTFHGLATQCARPTYDDIALHELLENLDDGTATHMVLDVDCLIIDECQDFRRSFYRLISHLVRTGDKTQYLLVGDTKQMLYDYDDEDPADLSFFEQPDAYFRSSCAWETVCLSDTYRCKPCISRFVSEAFEVPFSSAEPCDEGKVEVHTVNMWHSPSAVVMNTIREHQRLGTLDRCALLVPYKRNNRPLRSTVNALSRNAVGIYIHGVDGQDMRVRKNKLLVSTWHAAKGTEFETVIIFGASESALRRIPNAAFVGFTRAQQRLVIIHDVTDPSVAVLRAARKMKTSSSFYCDDATDGLLQSCADDVDDISDHSEAGAPDDNKLMVFALDDWTPCGSGRWFMNAFTVESHGDNDANNCDDEIVEIVEHDTGAEDIQELYRVGCLMSEEKRQCGSVSRWNDILSTSRADYQQRGEAIRAGAQTRFVEKNVPESILLDHASRRAFSATICKPMNMDDWCFVSCVCCAWGSFHNQLHQLKRGGNVMDQTRFRAGCAVIAAALETDGSDVCKFDFRLRATVDDNTVFHIRTDVTTSRCAFLFVWRSALTRQDDVRAALMAALHPQSLCECYNLRSGAKRTVRLYPERKRDLLKTLAALCRKSR